MPRGHNLSGVEQHTPDTLVSTDDPGDTEVIELDDTATQAVTTPMRRRRARKSVNLLAPLSLVLALAVSPLAMVFGYIAIGQIRRADQRGASMAWVAIALGWLWLVGYVVVFGALATIYLENPFWP